MQSRHGAVKNAFITGIGNNIVSLLAGIMIFGTVFSVLQTEMSMNTADTLDIMRTSGPASTGLTFIWMPQLFARMFLGKPLAMLFFLGLTFAGFSSIIAMLELPTRVLLDTGMRRSRAIGLVVAVVYLLGIPSARNLNLLSNQDFVWGIGLTISGAFIAFAIIRFGVGRMRSELNAVPGDWIAGRWWSIDISMFIPVAALALLAWWMFQSVTVFAPEDWYNPLNAFSLMTCVVQFLAVLLIFILLNRRISNAMKVQV
jgi:NSS family neurotransmitter:Na+ symporter